MWYSTVCDIRRYIYVMRSYLHLHNSNLFFLLLNYWTTTFIFMKFVCIGKSASQRCKLLEIVLGTVCTVLVFRDFKYEIYILYVLAEARSAIICFI